ncbi:hypothetical protein [Planctobacterium marinum]|uniref:hypothetical protein n=1 Tax=Planctobacterium marinum TaxID=1631968 RepID=UPI001E316ACB|nr:hypothetical protein [Planctobacterium marinum]MCC2606082.1 hypothetical protein [Planctobacterium marinum]
MSTEADTTGTAIPAEPISQVISALYKKLIRLNTRFDTQTVSAQHIELTEQLAEQILESLIASPNPLLAQLHFNKPNLPYFFNFQFNSIIFAALLVLRNNLNLTTAQQILCGIITWTITAKAQIDDAHTNASAAQNNQVKAQTIRVLNHFQRQIWVSLLTSISASELPKLSGFMQARNTTSPHSNFLILALYFATLITRKSHKPGLSYTHALQKMVQNSHSIGLGQLEPLLDYPGIFLPGSALTISGHQHALYLGKHQSEFYTLAYNAAEKRYSDDISVISEAQIQKVAPPINLNHIKLVEKWWGPQWTEVQALNKSPDSRKLYPKGFRPDRPPESLVGIIEHLNQQDIEVDKLIRLIQNEASFADHIQMTATQQSRENIKIKSVKHGLLMNGFERSRSVLVERALITRLTQHHFPLQDVIYQFVKLWASFASAIAQYHPRMLPEQASCWVYFAASGLFTHAELKLKQNWQFVDSEAKRDNHRIKLKEAQLLWHHAYKLAACWAQDKELRDALRDIPVKQPFPPTAPRTLAHTLLNLSLNLASSIFFKGEIPDYDSDEYLQHYCTRLRLDAAEYATVIEETMKNSHTYWPISNKCVFENG